MWWPIRSTLGYLIPPLFNKSNQPGKRQRNFGHPTSHKSSQRRKYDSHPTLPIFTMQDPPQLVKNPVVTQIDKEGAKRQPCKRIKTNFKLLTANQTSPAHIHFRMPRKVRWAYHKPRSHNKNQAATLPHHAPTKGNSDSLSSHLNDRAANKKQPSLKSAHKSY